MKEYTPEISRQLRLPYKNLETATTVGTMAFLRFYRPPLPIIAICILACISGGMAIQCYQCDSNEDYTCPSGYGFDKTVNAMLDCNGFEADIPGQFCVKIYQESPGWGGWQKTTRRCGSRTSFGVAWGCRWSWDYTGVFMETCYCEDADGCNESTRLSCSFVLLSLSLFSAFYYLLTNL